MHGIRCLKTARVPIGHALSNTGTSQVDIVGGARDEVIALALIDSRNSCAEKLVDLKPRDLPAPGDAAFVVVADVGGSEALLSERCQAAVAILRGTHNVEELTAKAHPGTVVHKVAENLVAAAAFVKVATSLNGVGEKRLRLVVEDLPEAATGGLGVNKCRGGRVCHRFQSLDFLCEIRKLGLLFTDDQSKSGRHEKCKHSN